MPLLNLTTTLWPRSQRLAKSGLKNLRELRCDRYYHEEREEQLPVNV